jgi:hypothetical protein
MMNPDREASDKGLRQSIAQSSRLQASALRGSACQAVMLDGVPAVHWWRLFIDKQHHGDAEKLDDPSRYYDLDVSKGHHTNMTEAFRSELIDGGGRLGTTVDLEEYVRLHDLVSAHLHDKEIVRRWSTERLGPEGDALPPVHYSIGGKGVPAADINAVKISGMNLLVAASPDVRMDERAIAVFDGARVQVNYSTALAPQRFVSEILKNYYNELRVSTLEAIVRVIRTLHVTHAFRDANGRLHVMLMLNKFLREQGFCPVILPNGPEVFGGSYTIPELEDEVRQGMKAFLTLKAGVAALPTLRCADVQP